MGNTITPTPDIPAVSPVTDTGDMAYVFAGLYNGRTGILDNQRPIPQLYEGFAHDHFLRFFDTSLVLPGLAA